MTKAESASVIFILLALAASFPVPAYADSCPQNSWVAGGRVSFTGSNMQLIGRCDQPELFVNLDVQSGNIQLDFNWWGRRDTIWGESPGWKVFVNGVEKSSGGISTGRDAVISGHVATTLATNGNVVLLFLVAPSAYCGSGDHGNTQMWIDDVVVKKGAGTIFSDSFGQFSSSYKKCGSTYNGNNCYNPAIQTCIDSGSGIVRKNNGQSCSADYECAGKYCEGGKCASCSMSVCGLNWNNYNCYNGAVEACTDNGNGVTKKRFRQGCSAGSECTGGHCGSDGKCEDVFDVSDITNYCPYNSATRTYSCTGWENIYVQNDIGLPNVNCGYTRACRTNGVLAGCNPTNIIFKANNEFTARNFYATNAGDGGSITIEAKKITAASLNTYGSTCTDSQCSCGGPFCGSNTGGPVTLTGDTIDIGTINANDGAGRGGSGGTISVSGKTTRIGTVYSQGAGYSCSYNYGYTNGAGSGGAVRIKSGSANIGTIYLGGGGGSYADSGGSGGSARLEAGDLTLGSISATGGYRNGGGGSVTMLSSKSSITGTVSVAGYSSGADGAIKIGSDSISSQTLTTRGSGSGGSAKVYIDTYTIPSLSSSYVSFVTNNTPQNRAFISAGTLVFGPRTKGAIIGFSTGVPDTSARSFQLRMKDLSGAYVRSFGQEWHEEGTITQAGKVSKEIGRDFPLSGFNSGKKYILVLTTSRDQVFDQARCSSGAASCNSYEVGFVEWT